MTPHRSTQGHAASTADSDLGERLAGGLVGLLVGDALGVPYEFNPPRMLPPRAEIDMPPAPDWQSTHNVPPGTWSDDGAHALCLLDSLLVCDGLNLDDFGARLLRWYRQACLQVGGCSISGAVPAARDSSAPVLPQRRTPILPATARRIRRVAVCRESVRCAPS